MYFKKEVFLHILLTSMGSWRQNFFTFCISALSLVPRCPILLSGMDTVGRPTVTRCSEHEEMRDQPSCFGFMDSFMDSLFFPKGKCDKDWLTNQYVIFWDLNKMPPVYALRGWLWFLPSLQGLFLGFNPFPCGAGMPLLPRVRSLS